MSGGTYLGRPIQSLQALIEAANGAGASQNLNLAGTENSGTLFGYRFDRPVILVALSSGVRCTGAGGGGEEINVYAYNDGVAGTDEVFDPITFDMSSTGVKGERMETIANPGEEEFSEANDLLIRAIKDAGSYTGVFLWAILEYVEL